MREPSSLRLTDFTFVDVTVEQMGAGGFGLVFMGPNRLTGGEWRALKTLRPELLALRPQLRDLFLSECLTWVGLWPHANLLTAQAATEIDGHLFIELDYAEHGSLRDLLTFDQPFASRFRWAQHIAAGLLALHTPDPEFLRPSPLVHRDLKPENVLVNKSGYAMITDFGLAAAIGEAIRATGAHSRDLDDVGATRSTRAGVTRLGGAGTIAYMPPEQWDVDGDVGPAADLYAFGLILSELLAGRHGLADLEAELDEEGWYQLHLNGTPRPLRSGPTEDASRLPVEVEQLYRALVAKRPKDRPSAEEALSILQQAAAQLGEEPYKPPDIYPRTDEHRRMKWSNWAITCAHFDLFKEALERNERALTLDPHKFDLLHARGSMLGTLALRSRGAGRYEEGRQLLNEALGWYDRALDAATTDIERGSVQGMRALQLSHLDYYAEAESAFALSLAARPDDGNSWFNRAINAVRHARAEADAGRQAEAPQLLELAEEYIDIAAHLGLASPQVAQLLGAIQQLRARLGG